jgi:hypothetical protein
LNVYNCISVSAKIANKERKSIKRQDILNKSDLEKVYGKKLYRLFDFDIKKKG